MKNYLAEHRFSSWSIDIGLLSILLLSLFFILLGDRPLFVPDEGRYAEIAREMIKNGNYITPYLNDIKYFEKPPLFYWLEVLSIKWNGLGISSVRAVNALLAFIGCMMTYVFTRKIYDRTTGLFAACILGTSCLYFVMAHMASLDLPVTVFLAACCYCFIGGTKTNALSYYYGAALFAGLAVLTKGLIGLFLPFIIIMSWIAFTAQWQLLRKIPIFSAFLVFLAITLPWHALVTLKNPEFFHFYFIEQHILRYSTQGIGHDQPVWFFIPCLIAGFFPWIIFLPQTLWHSFRNKTDLFLMLWVILIFAFFSFSQSKLIPYLLPIFPPLSILTARYLTRLPPTTLGHKISYWALVFLSICIAIALLRYLKHNSFTHPNQALFYLLITSTVFMTGSTIAAIFAQSYHQYAIPTLILTSILSLLSMLAAIPAIETRSILPLAKQLKPLLTPESEVMTYHRYYQDLPFYLERRITIVKWRNEFTFGMKYQNTQDWMINDNTFWQRWHQAKRVYAIMGNDDYAYITYHHPNESIFLLGKTLTTALVSNQK